MTPIAIQALPNQSLSVVILGDRYDFRIVETRGCMSITISKNGELLVSNIRMVAGTPLLPYRYLEEGNFMVLNLADEMIYYPQFGSTQQLVYLTPTDLANLRGSNGGS